MKLVERMKSAIVRSLSLTSPQLYTRSAPASDAGELVTESSIMALTTVWACANLISGSVATLPLATYEKKDNRREVLRSHPLYRVLHDSPNFDQTAFDFWQYIQCSLEFWGNAYAEIKKSGGVITSLVPIPPALVQVERRSNGSLEYRWTFEGKNYIRRDVDVFHVRGFGGNPLGGMSTLHFGRNMFGLARATDRAAGGMFRNGLRPSGALTFADYPGGKTSAEVIAKAEADLQEKYVGAVNTGKPMILYGGAKWDSITINPDDAQMLESRRFSVEEVCRWFGVPPHMVGHTENSTSWGTGIEQQTLGYQKFTLGPRLRRIEQAIEKQLLTPSDKASGVTIKFNVEGLLRGDSAGRASYYQTMSAMGAMTINEIRALENMPPVVGGDVPRMQMQNVPIQEAGNDGTD